MCELLVPVDYQIDFVSGSLGFPGAELIDEGIANEIINHKGPIVVSLDTHPKHYLKTREGLALPVEHTIENAPGWFIYGKTGEELERRRLSDDPPIFIKKTSFGIAPEDMVTLKETLHKKGFQVQKIRLVGLVSNICVISQAITFQAAFPEAQIIVDNALCASFDPVLHEKAMDVLEGLQVKVINR